jgi:hypothetical protein
MQFHFLKSDIPGTDNPPKGILFLFLLGTTLWLFAFQQIIFTMALYYMGFSIIENQLYFHLISQGFITFFVFKKFSSFSVKWIVLCFALQMLFFAGSVFFEKAFLDTSYDGQTYHQKGIIELAKGYNPVLTGHSDDLIKHYPKGCWIPGSIVYRSLGNVEAAKYVNVYYLGALFFICFYTFFVLYNYRKFSGIALTLLVAIAVSFHPVVIMKFFNSYADGQLCCLMGITLCNFILAIKAPKYFHLALLSGLVMITFKFTGVVYFIVFLSGFFCWQFFSKQLLKKYLYNSTTIIFILLFAILLYHPLIENTLFHSHPFFPINVLGTDNQLIDSMKNNNRFTNTLICLFAKPDLLNSATIPEFIFPFSSVSLWLYESNIDTFAGFGPFFSGIFVLSVFAFIFIFFFEKNFRKTMLFISLILFVSVFVNPGCWWLRWVPQFYWLVLLPVIYAVYSKKKWLSFFGIIIFLIALSNAVLLYADLYKANQSRTKEVEEQLQVLTKYKVNVDTCFCISNIERLHFYKIEYTLLSDIQGEKFNMKYAPCFFMQPIAPLVTDTILANVSKITNDEFYIFADKLANRPLGFFTITGKSSGDCYLVITGDKGYHQQLEMKATDKDSFNFNIETSNGEETLRICLWNPAKNDIHMSQLTVLRTCFQ